MTAGKKTLLRSCAISPAICLFIPLLLVGCFQQPAEMPLVVSLEPDTALPAVTFTHPVETSLSHSEVPSETQEQAIQLMFFLPVEGPFQVGSEAAALIYSEPVIISRLTGKAGEFLGMSILPWEVNPFELEEEMCIAWDKPCPLEGSWMYHNERLVLHRKVEWVGTRQLWVTVRYRDSSGKSIPIEYGGKELVEIAQVSLAVEGAWDRATPVEALPAPVQTAIAQTQVAYPLTGSVTWEDGRCCAGGTARETIQLRADFTATSPHGEVVEMRVQTGSTCITEGEMEQGAWEPFVSQRSFPFALPINWVGFYITVQYRDLHGNLSPAICDDISLEGMPQRTP